MPNTEKNDDRYWHRLTDALHILSAHLRLPLCLLFSDAHERVEKLWRRHHKTKQDGHPPVPSCGALRMRIIKWGQTLTYF